MFMCEQQTGWPLQFVQGPLDRVALCCGAAGVMVAGQREALSQRGGDLGSVQRWPWRVGSCLLPATLPGHCHLPAPCARRWVSSLLRITPFGEGGVTSGDL